MPSQNFSVLLVDDDSFFLEMLTAKFVSAGYQTKSASSARAAFVHLHGGFSPDVVLFDVVMPEMQGFEFIRQMKAEHLAPRAHLVALTNEDRISRKDDAEEVGVELYLIKASLIPSEIVAKIGALLGQKV